jgi:CubicO group peptidase (beta-lactamase class C family)
MNHAEKLGFSPQRLNRIRILLQRFVDEGKLPGFVTLVARRGEIAYWDVVGYRDVAAQRPYTPDTIVRIYSMTKPITSVALLMLYEQSLFNLHDPLYAFLPEFKDSTVYENGQLVSARTPITIQHILTHTAGFTYGYAEGHPVDLLYEAADLDNNNRSSDEIIKNTASLPLRFHPGTKWHYGVATDVVGRLVEVISGQNLADFIDTYICQPLGMIDSAFHIDPQKLDRFATLYHVTPEDPLAVFDEPEKSRYLPPVTFHSGGAGMVSTIGDYFRFAQCLANKGVLDGVPILGRKTVERMRLNHLAPELLPPGQDTSEPMYGQGFGLGVSTVLDISQTGFMGSNGNHGWGGYAETIFWIDPQEELVVINMTQCIPSSHYPVRQLHPSY